MYVAGRRIRVNGEWRDPGEAVPEAATWPNLDAYLGRGEIVAGDARHVVDLSRIGSFEDLVALAEEHGVGGAHSESATGEPMLIIPPGAAWEEILDAAAAVEIDLPPWLADLRGLDDVGAVAALAGRGFNVALHQPAADAPAADLNPAAADDPAAGSVVGGRAAPSADALRLAKIPDPLPATRAALAAIAEALPLEVKGTGSGGYVKEGDYAAALSAERERLIAALAAS